MRNLDTHLMPLFSGFCSNEGIIAFTNQIKEAGNLAHDSIQTHAEMQAEFLEIQEAGGIIHAEQFIMLDQQAKLAQSYLDICNESTERREVARSVLN